MAAAIVALLLAVGAGTASASGNHVTSIEAAGIALSEQLQIVEGISYVPVRDFVERMGWQIAYDKETRLVQVENAYGDVLAMAIGSTQLSFNGETYEQSITIRLEQGIAYFPLRLLAEAMHAAVEWDPATKSVTVIPVQPHIVAEDESLMAIAERYETTAQALQLRNGLADDAIQIGQPLKVIVPSFMDKQDEPLNDELEVDEYELDLLARLVQVEAGHEPYEGKLAVASVVMNRVNSDRFPASVKDVIYAPNQFPPATNGKLDKAEPSEDSIKAARAALMGENNVPGAVYFFNAKIEPRKLKMVEVVKVIGNHTFGK